MHSRSPGAVGAVTVTARAPEVRALTGLRIVAAMWVVLFHWSFTPGTELQGLRDTLHPLLFYGYLGVDVFYVLSGYVITLTYLEKLGPRFRLGLSGHYMWARICRIWPVYALVTILFGLWLLSERARVGPGADITFQTRQPDLGVWSWIKQLLMVQQWSDPWSDGVSFVGPAWSVSAEVLAYLLFPLAVLVLYRVRNLPWWILAAGSVLVMAPMAYHAYTTGQPYFPYSWMVRLFTGFTAGALACLAVRQLQENGWDARDTWVSRTAATVAILAVAGFGGTLVWADGSFGDRSAAGTVLFPLIVGALALSTTGLSKVLATGPLVTGGRVSYSLYLVHVPIFEIMWIKQMQHEQIATGSRWAELLVPGLIVAAVGIGYLVWEQIEEPARHALRDLVEDRSAHPMPIGAATVEAQEEASHHHTPWHQWGPPHLEDRYDPSTWRGH